MDIVLTALTEKHNVSMGDIVFFSNDEIIIDVSKPDQDSRLQIANQIENSMGDMPVPLKLELYTLHKLAGSDGYYKQFVNEKGGNEIELKCLDNYAFCLKETFRARDYGE
ncbi:MAG: hypothetical protein HFH05_14750 [Lachnospiraceae bacterium]|nr:hypothetical protein [Lachnospiraceae bacterium]